MSSLVPSWQFTGDGVRGYIAGGGGHGVEIVAVDGVGMDEAPGGTRPMCMNLEHYYARSHRGGRFVPRLKADVRSYLDDDGAVRVRIAPYEQWQVETTIAFRVSAGPVVEVCYEFRFEADFVGFEAFVSNYFHDPGEPLIRLGGAWVRPALTNGEHRFWARGAIKAENIAAVYPPELTPQDNIDLPIDDARFDVPLMVTPLAETGFSVVNAVEPNRGGSISANTKWNAHDFSILVGDVAAGDAIACRAWLACLKLAEPDDALALFDRLLGRTTDA